MISRSCLNIPTYIPPTAAIPKFVQSIRADAIHKSACQHKTAIDSPDDLLLLLGVKASMCA